MTTDLQPQAYKGWNLWRAAVYDGADWPLMTACMFGSEAAAFAFARLWIDQPLHRELLNRIGGGYTKQQLDDVISELSAA